MAFEYVPVVRVKTVKESQLPYHFEERLNMPEKGAKFIKKVFEDVDREYIVVVAIDSKSKPLSVEVVGIGTLNSAMTSIREIFKNLILSNAAGFLLFHNHPSGEVEPSEEDRWMTRKLKKAGELLDIPLQDHIIIGTSDKNSYFSFAEQALLNEVC